MFHEENQILRSNLRYSHLPPVFTSVCFGCLKPLKKKRVDGATHFSYWFGSGSVTWACCLMHRLLISSIHRELRVSFNRTLSLLSSHHPPLQEFSPRKHETDNTLFTSQDPELAGWCDVNFWEDFVPPASYLAVLWDWTLSYLSLLSAPVWHLFAREDQQAGRSLLLPFPSYYDNHHSRGSLID